MNADSVSFVITGRNDNYGGDFVKRLSNSLKWNSRLAEKHSIQVELIFIELNPPEKTRLSDLDIWPSTPFWKTRIIEVEDPFNDFDEFQAKNIGICNATHDRVLSLNADILLPEWLFANINSFEDNHIYLADRLNIPIVSDNWHQMIRNANQYCLKGAILKRPAIIPHKLFYNLVPIYLLLRRVFYSMFPFLIRKEIQTLLKYSFTASGDFMLASRSTWNKLNGFRENNSESLHIDSLFLLKALSHGVYLRDIPVPIIHQNHTHRYKLATKSKDFTVLDEMLFEAIRNFHASSQPIHDNVLDGPDKNYRIKKQTDR